MHVRTRLPETPLPPDPMHHPTRFRPGDRAALLLLLAMAGLGGAWLHSAVASRNACAATPAGVELVRGLGLTGLALFTEARYTRHPELSDPREALRNHPMAMEHFPSGTWVPPPSRRHD